MDSTIPSHLLDDLGYHALVAQTHPDFLLNRSRLPLPSYVAPFDLRDPLYPGWQREALDVIRRAVPDFACPRTLFLGVPFEPYEQTRHLDQVPDPAALVKDARQAALGLDADLVVLPAVSSIHPRFAEWIAAGFVEMPGFPDTILRLAHPDFESYLHQLRPRQRESIRRNLRAFERAGHVVETRPLRCLDAEALVQCYDTLFDRAVVRWLKHTQAYFDRLAHHRDGPGRILVARSPQGELIGFIVCFEDATGFHAGRMGIHPRWYRRDAVYFRLLYALIEFVILSAGNQETRLSLEPTAYRVKRSLGAELRPLCNLVLGARGLWRKIDLLRRPANHWIFAHLGRADLLENKY